MGGKRATNVDEALSSSLCLYAFPIAGIIQIRFQGLPHIPVVLSAWLNQAPLAYGCLFIQSIQHHKEKRRLLFPYLSYKCPLILERENVSTQARHHGSGKLAFYLRERISRSDVGLTILRRRRILMIPLPGGYG